MRGTNRQDIIQKICTPLLNCVKPHLANTGQLLKKLDVVAKEMLKHKILFSLDVVSLYPSVDNDTAITTLEGERSSELFFICVGHYSANDPSQQLFFVEWKLLQARTN